MDVAVGSSLTVLYEIHKEKALYAAVRASRPEGKAAYAFTWREPALSRRGRRSPPGKEGQFHPLSPLVSPRFVKLLIPLPEKRMLTGMTVV